MSINHIRTEFEVVDKIFICNMVDNPNQYFCTFAIDYLAELPKGVIIIHRKAETRTLYTINAMNEIIKKCNNGKFVENYQLDWDCYVDCLITYKTPDVIMSKYLVVEQIKF